MLTGYRVRYVRLQAFSVLDGIGDLHHQRGHPGAHRGPSHCRDRVVVVVVGVGVMGVVAVASVAVVVVGVSWVVSCGLKIARVETHCYCFVVVVGNSSRCLKRWSA